MTRDGHGTGPDETPAPPTSSRWSQAESGDDDTLLPPFVPGRRAPAGTPVDAHAPDAATDKVATDEGTTDEGTTDVAAAGEPGTDDGTYPFDDSPDDDEPFPWADSPSTESEADDPTDEPSGQPSDQPAGEPPGEWWPGGDEVGVAELEPGEAEGAVAAGLGGADPDVGEPDWRAADKAGESRVLAEVLERLAYRLRADGARGAEEEMASSDRMTALLAGLIAGYLAGRDV